MIILAVLLRIRNQNETTYSNLFKFDVPLNDAEKVYFMQISF